MFSFVATNLKTLGKTEYGDAVDDAEVGTLSLGALVALHLVNGSLVYLCSCCGVYVVTAAECLNHVLIATKVCHHAQLYLTVVGREKQATVFWYECLANLLAVFAAHRNILKVRVA